MAYRMRRNDDGSGTYTITEGKDLAGWCRQWGKGIWEARTLCARGLGHTPEEAFGKLMKHVREYEAATKPKAAPKRKKKQEQPAATTPVPLEDFGTCMFVELSYELSPSEQRLMGLLPPDGTPVSTDVLANAYWRGRRKPYNNRIVITNLTRALVRKTAAALPRVRKSKPTGPHPTTVWLESSTA